MSRARGGERDGLRSSNLRRSFFCFAASSCGRRDFFILRREADEVRFGSMRVIRVK